MPHGTTRIGDIEVTALCDVHAHFPMPFAKAFPTIPPERHDGIRARYPEAFDGPDTWRFPDHCFLVRTAATLILFDTGVGRDTLGAEWLGTQGSLPSELEAVGVAPGDVDVVAISHTHLDHVGWNLVHDEAGEPVPLFPNARYALQRAEWDGFTLGGDRDDLTAFDESMGPLHSLGVLELVDGTERVTEGVTLHLAAGHTPGHQVMVLESGTDRAVLTGDLANHPAQTAEPSWRTGADMDPMAAGATRAEWLARIEEWRALICTTHFPEPFGRLARDGAERIWTPA